MTGSSSSLVESSSSSSSCGDGIENTDTSNARDVGVVVVWDPSRSFVRSTVVPEINKGVLRKKLAKQRHLVVPAAIDPEYLDALFPHLLQLFDPQTVYYNGGIARVPEWKISCYLEVMPGGVPTAHPNTTLLDLFRPLLHQINDLFLHWYRQQHACNSSRSSNGSHPSVVTGCHRLMTFVTKYTPQPGQDALLKVHTYIHAYIHIMLRGFFRRVTTPRQAIRFCFLFSLFLLTVILLLFGPGVVRSSTSMARARSMGP